MTSAGSQAAVIEMVASITKLTSLPTVVTRVTAVLQDPRATIGQIVAVVEQNAAFAIQILRVANSAFFGASRDIDSLSKAITLIGTLQVRDLALGLAVARTFRGIPNTLLSMQTFWSHSVLCAVCAKLLASEKSGSNADTAFVGGLLHDIGKVVLAIQAPEQTRKALTTSRKDPVNQLMYRCEREIFGFDQADIGGELMRRWQLPAKLVAAVEFHHEPERAKEFAHAAALVHIANVLTHLAERDSLEPTVAPPIHPFAWRATGLAPDAIARVVPAARAAVAEVKMLFNFESSR